MTIRIISKGNCVKTRIRNVKHINVVTLNGKIIIEYRFFYDNTQREGYSLQDGESFQVVNDF